MEEKEVCYYSAKSVIGQLEARRLDLKPISLYGLKCPFTESDPAVRLKCHPHECLDYRDIGECSFCSSNKCQQRAHIHTWPGAGHPLIILRFFFAVSRDNRDGYIEKGDSQLEQLILYGYINESKLVPVTLP